MVANNATFYSLSKIFDSEAEARKYLVAKEVFYEHLPCSKCGKPMSRSIDRWKFSCWSRSCRLEKSVYSHTFFAGTKLTANQILLLGKLWLDKASIDTAISFTGHSGHTVGGFWRHFRQLVSSTLETEDDIIGGREVVVQIDETKLGRRKYNRGHRVEGVWVVVGVELTESRKVFIVPVEKRDAQTLREVIKAHVLPHSRIQTDLWKGYEWLEQDPDYTHQTVNHSIEFKNSETGVHTNIVEGTNGAIKRRISVRNRVRVGIEGHLDEFVWRRKHEKEALWECFISALRDIHFELE
jgi:transposase-like protein